MRGRNRERKKQFLSEEKTEVSRSVGEDRQSNLTAGSEDRAGRSDDSTGNCYSSPGESPSGGEAIGNGPWTAPCSLVPNPPHVTKVLMINGSFKLRVCIVHVPSQR